MPVNRGGQGLITFLTGCSGSGPSFSVSRVCVCARARVWYFDRCGGRARGGKREREREHALMHMWIVLHMHACVCVVLLALLVSEHHPWISLSL